MIRLSRNQCLFTVVAVGLTTAFVVMLYGHIGDKAWGSIPMLAIGYGIAMFLAGLAFGATDPVARSRSDLGFGYHAITFVVVAVIGIGAAIYYTQPVWPQLVGLAGWFVGLSVHYLFSRRTIKGIEREEAFP